MKQKLTWVFVIAFSGLIGLFMLVLTAPRNHVYDRALTNATPPL